MSASAKTLILGAIKEAIKKDRDHLIVIPCDYIAGRFLPSSGVEKDFHCEDFDITNRVMTVYATGDRKPVVDGASFSPDKLGDLDLAAGYIAHDLMYAHMADMAKAWDWDEVEIRALADMVLGQAIQQTAKRMDSPIYQLAGSLVARVYYWTVRAVGGIYHKIASWFTVFLALLCLGSALCIGGCAVPDGFELEDVPDYTVKPRAEVLA